MNGQDCQNVGDLLPSLAGGTLQPDQAGPVREHLADCPDCRLELEVVQAVLLSEPQVPEGLEGRIKARVQEEFGGMARPTSGAEDPDTGPTVLPFYRRRIPVWGLSAAAVVILALGTSRIWNNGNQEPMQDPVVLAAQEPLPEAWLLDDGMIAGAPVFDGLSDEDLEALLEEFEG